MLNAAREARGPVCGEIPGTAKSALQVDFGTPVELQIERTSAIDRPADIIDVTEADSQAH